jgi:inorganic pyrophosphatase
MFNYKKITKGTTNQLDYKIFLSNYDKIISYIDDIPFINNEYYNMIVEIPQNSNIKMEICKDQFNPIKYDIKNNNIRITNLPYPYNYGAIPQTWENPNVIDEYTSMKGDDDPLDIFDISNIKSITGDIIQVKILGAICMIDDNCTDWKIIGQNINDKNTYNLQDIKSKITYFLKNYKLKNVIVFDKLYNKQETIKIINKLHQEWFHHN